MYCYAQVFDYQNVIKRYENMGGHLIDGYNGYNGYNGYAVSFLESYSARR